MRLVRCWNGELLHRICKRSVIGTCNFGKATVLNYNNVTLFAQLDITKFVVQ